MTLQEYAAVLRRRWPLIVVATLVGSLLGLGLSAAQKPVYEADAQLMVSVSSLGQVGEDAYWTGQFVQHQAPSYAELVSSPIVLNPVIEELQLDTTYQALASQVKVKVSALVFLDLTASADSAAEAADIANATAASLGEQIARLPGVEVTKDGPSGGGEDPQVVPITRVNVALGGFLGLLLAVAAVVLRNAFDGSDVVVADRERAEQPSSGEGPAPVGRA